MQQRRCFMEAVLEKEVWLRITVTCYKVLIDNGRTAITMYSIVVTIVLITSDCPQTMLSFGHFHLIIYLLCSVIMQAHNNSRAGNDPLQ